MTSNNAQKRAAKLYQLQYPGTPYPEALRIVSRLAALRPLTSIVSTDPKGRFERFHFEESAWGGAQVHIVESPERRARARLICSR